MTTSPKRARRRGLHTIGAVCERLRDEFPDISISKIRYLEDQGLLQPSRTRGRLQAVRRGRCRAADHDPAPAARRVPATAGDPRGASRADRRPRKAPRGRPARAGGGDRHGGAVRPRRHLVGVRAPARGVRPARARIEGGERLYRESDADIALACAKIARHGIDARHLRAFRTAAGRQSALLEQVVAPALRSRNLERRAAALEDLEALAGRRAGAGPAAADARSARGGGAMTRARSGKPDPRRPGLPDRGDHVQGRDAADRRSGGVSRDDRPARRVGRPAGARCDPGRRGARVHLRRRARVRARLRLRDGPEARQAAVGDDRGDATTSSTAPTRSRCTSTRSSPVRG